MKKYRKYLIPIAIILGAILIFVALVSSRPPPKTKDVKEQEWLVNAEQVEIVSAQPVLTLYGKIESRNQSLLTSTVEADVVQVVADEGASVSRDAVLIKLQNREAKLRLDQRQAELAEIKANIDSETQRHKTDLALLKNEQQILELTESAVQRVQSLKDQQLGSQSQLDEMLQARVRQSVALTNRKQAIEDHPNRLAQLKARLAQAQSRLTLAQLDLEQTTIRAPFNGSVTSVKVSEGERVRPGTPLLEIIEKDDLEVRTQIPSNHLQAVQLAFQQGNSKAYSLIDGKSYSLTLQRLSSKIEPGKGVIDAFLVFDTPDHGLQSGRMIEVILNLPPIEEVVAVPYEALYGVDQIYVIKDQRLNSLKVTLKGETRHISQPGRFLVQSKQIHNGDSILITKFANAVDGLRVKVQETTRE